MEIAKLILVFFVILGMLKFKKPLWLAVVAGSVAACLLYPMGLVPTLQLVGKSAVNPDTIALVAAIYLITFLQLLLEKRGRLKLAEQSLSGLCNSRRVNASIIPMFMGFLPAPGSVLIAAPMVDSACGDYLDKNEKTFVTSFYRHIPESSLPTYASVILSVQLSGVAMSSFIIGMLPMILVMMAVPYLLYLRKVPKETGLPPSQNRWQEFKNLCLSIWPIVLIIVLIVGQVPFVGSVWAATLTGVLAFGILNRFRWEEIRPMFKGAFHFNSIASTFVIMIFKDIITATGVIHSLPEVFSQLPIPTFLVFALIFFFGTIVSGSQAIIAMCMTAAFAAIPGGGMPLLVLLSCFNHMAMQISPTHICLALATQYFDTEMKDLLIKTAPVEVIVLLISVCYYLVLTAIF